MPASQVLVNLIHTHSAPGLGSYMDLETPEQRALIEKFWKQILRGAKKAVRTALAKMRPARIVTGWGECYGNINRRQRTPEGDVLLGEDEAGACDCSADSTPRARG